MNEKSGRNKLKQSGKRGNNGEESVRLSNKVIYTLCVSKCVIEKDEIV